MPLTPGSRLGPYEILAPLGAGGMGEVYRARDLKLDRDVAVKVLPESVGQDADALSRFEREAKAVAALSHPNILSIHDFGTHEGITYAVMELLEGDTLRDKLEAGPISQKRAVDYALQVAKGLSAAHEKGIVHRDLKPENLFVTKDGHLKILDFGLAKRSPVIAPGEETSAPTASGHTQPGTVMGTVGYMSPEQVRGLPVDHRSDIFSFGAILYELLSGWSAFKRDTASDTMAAILKEDPPELSATNKHVSPSLERIARHCLAKSSEQRFQSAHDLVFDLEALSDESAPAVLTRARAVATGRKRWEHLAWRLLAGLSIVLSVALFIALGKVSRMSQRAGSSTSLGLVHFEIGVNPSEPIGAFAAPPMAISPDGRSVVFVSSVAREPSLGRSGPAATTQLFLRRFDHDDSEPLAGTENAAGPFFSPDGEWLAFVKGRYLVKLSLRSGTLVRLASTDETTRGGTWSSNGEIVFTPTWFSGLYRVSAEGGQARPLTTLREGEKSHRYPYFLPDGSAVLFVSCNSTLETFDDAPIEAVSLATGERKVLLTGGGAPKFLAPGTLLFPRAGRLFAVPFDPKSLSVTGEAVPVVDHLLTAPVYGVGAFDVSRAGDLAYFPGGPEVFTMRAARFTLAGDRTLLGGLERVFHGLRFSPDGKKLLVNVDDANGSIWVYDFDRETMTRIAHGWDDDAGVWSADGKSVFFLVTKGAKTDIARVRADGAGSVEIVYSGKDLFNLSISRKGDVLVFEDNDPKTGSDIYWLRPNEKTPRVYLKTPANEKQPELSPNGRWLAYTSDESGRDEVYVQAFPEATLRQQISARGGVNPLWSPDGRELFYRDGSAVMAATVTTEGPFSASKPRVLVDLHDSGYARLRTYDIAPDGKTFISAVRDPNWHPADRLRIVVNWRQELLATLKGAMRR